MSFEYHIAFGVALIVIGAPWPAPNLGTCDFRVNFPERLKKKTDRGAIWTNVQIKMSGKITEPTDQAPGIYFGAGIKLSAFTRLQDLARGERLKSPPSTRPLDNSLRCNVNAKANEGW